MNKKIKYIAGLIAGLTLAAPAISQDFYNGCRGPKPFQADNYANYTNGNVSVLVVPKLFSKNLDDVLPDLVLAAPFSISGNGIRNEGVTLGVIVNGEANNFIGAVGVFRDENGYNILNPQLYFTHIDGPWTFDLEGNIPINLRTQHQSGFISTTIGYGLNERLRFGGSVSYSTQSGLDYQGIGRIELEKNHRYWAQIYANDKKVGARLVVNF